MDYQVVPFAGAWSNGIFNVPNDIVDRYIKLASEYQLKALLIVLRHGGSYSTSQIAKILNQSESDVDDLMELWVEEGLVAVNGQAPVVSQPAAPVEVEDKPKKKEALSAPRLTPKDIVEAIRDNKDIGLLVNQAQVILGRTISTAEQEMLINMVNYYGLKVEVIMMILEFYRNEKEQGKAIGISYVNAMAKNWSEEGINSIADAEEKLKYITQSDRLWNEVVAITGIRHRRPSDKQRAMVKEWFDSFDITMITLAADVMKDNTDSPSLSYMNTILKKWKSKGISSPQQFEKEQEEFEKNKSKKSGQLQSAPTYDLDAYGQFASDNTDI